MDIDMKGSIFNNEWQSVAYADDINIIGRWKLAAKEEDKEWKEKSVDGGQPRWWKWEDWDRPVT